MEGLLESAKKYPNAQAFICATLDIKAGNMYEVKVGRIRFCVNANSKQEAKRKAVSYWYERRAEGEKYFTDNIYVSEQDVEIIREPWDIYTLVDFEVEDQRKTLARVTERAKTSEFAKESIISNEKILKTLEGQRDSVYKLREIREKANKTK